MKEIGEILSKDEANAARDEENVSSRYLARMAKFDRMRPYLKEETYQILIHQDWGD